MTGHSVVNSSYFTSEAEKEQAIANLQSRIDSERQSSARPGNSVADAQRRYDDFVAQVPW